MHMHLRIHMHMHIYTYACTYTCTYTHMQEQGRRGGGGQRYVFLEYQEILQMLTRARTWCFLFLSPSAEGFLLQARLHLVPFSPHLLQAAY